MVYVFCRRPSDSAKALVEGLGAKRIRRFDGQNFWRRARRVDIKPNDAIICWGEIFPIEDELDFRVINGADVGNKYEQAVKLREAGINTVLVTRNARGAHGWIPRRNDHVGGNDLLSPCYAPDYYVSKMHVAEEYRIHVFGKRSIRAGVKRLREGYTLSEAEAAQSNGRLKLASSWVRSYDGGWRVVYDNFQASSELRKLAYNAVEKLGLTFGAVDIGLLDERHYGPLAANKYIVFEVNRAPGLEGGSITAYVNKLREWIDSTGTQERKDESNAARSEGATRRVETPPAPAPRERNSFRAFPVDPARDRNMEVPFAWTAAVPPTRPTAPRPAAEQPAARPQIVRNIGNEDIADLERRINDIVRNLRPQRPAERLDRINNNT